MGARGVFANWVWRGWSGGAKGCRDRVGQGLGEERKGKRREILRGWRGNGRTDLDLQWLLDFSLWGLGRW